jgi:hypothetical protein
MTTQEFVEEITDQPWQGAAGRAETVMIRHAAVLAAVARQP